MNSRTRRNSLLRRTQSSALWIVPLILIIFVIHGSPTYQACVDGQASQKTIERQQSGAVAIVHILRAFLVLRWGCGGRFVAMNYDGISAIAAVAVAIFTLTLWRSTDKLWKAGEKQQRLAERALRTQIAGIKASNEIAVRAANAAIAAQRAWISIDVEAYSPFTFRQQGAQLGLRAITKNIGNSPATKVHVTAIGAVEVAALRNYPLKAAMEKAISMSQAMTESMYGKSVFPHENTFHNCSVLIPQEDIDVALKNKDDLNKIFTYVVMVADYQYSGGTGRTCVAFQVFDQEQYLGKLNIIDYSDRSIDSVIEQGRISFLRMPYLDSAS